MELNIYYLINEQSTDPINCETTWQEGLGDNEIWMKVGCGFERVLRSQCSLLCRLGRNFGWLLTYSCTLYITGFNIIFYV